MGKFYFLICLIVSALARTDLAPFQGRIFGGELAEQGEFPSQVSLAYLRSHLCGATIISENLVLTAAQCVENIHPSDLTIRSGSIYINGGEVHQISRIIMHDSYNVWESRINDIAILEVEPAFTFGPNVQPSTLPNQADEPEVDAPGTVIGWGEITGGANWSDFLLKVVIQIKDQAQCEGVYSSLGYIIYPGQICAGYNEGYLGSCTGDTGGPLFVDGVVVGLVSWGNGCATPGYPTVHTRVAYYRDWIASETGI